MKTITFLICIAALAILAYGAEKVPSKLARQADPSMAKFLKLHLAFEAGDNPRFIVTLTNDADSSLKVSVQPDKFFGVFRNIVKPKDQKFELYDKQYWIMKGTGFYMTPNQILESHQSIKWNVPISTLIDFKRQTGVTPVQLSGLLFEAYIEKLAILPMNPSGSYTAIGAAKASNQVRIP